jgi:hypothetical protein
MQPAKFNVRKLASRVVLWRRDFQRSEACAGCQMPDMPVRADAQTRSAGAVRGRTRGQRRGGKHMRDPHNACRYPQLGLPSRRVPASTVRPESSHPRMAASEPEGTELCG